MNFKRSILFCLVLSAVLKTGAAIACCAGDPTSLTELLVSSTDQRAILLVTVDSSWTDQQYAFRSMATVNKSYKYPPKDAIIFIGSGYGNSSAGGHFLKKGAQYLLVSGTRDGKNYGGFVCDKFSYQLGPNRNRYPRIIDQMIFIKEYFEKVENQFTGPIQLELEGKIYMEGFLKNGIPHGEFKHYETKGYGKDKDQHLLKSQATYINGKLDGKNIEYRNQYHRDYEIHHFYNNGILLKTETWYPGVTGLYLAAFREYTDFGDFLLTRTISSSGEDTLQQETSSLKLKKLDYDYNLPNDLRNIYHHIHRRYSKTGVLLEEGTYFWGARVGHWIWYHEDATIKEEKFYETPERPENLVTLFHPEGTVKIQGSLHQGLPEGRWNYYGENGELHFHVFYKNGRLNGTIRRLYKDSSSEFDFVDGKKHGAGKYFRKGKLTSTENYKNGERDGLFQTYDKDGILRSSTSYKDGHLHGTQFRLSPEGDTLSLRNYTNGYLDGLYRTTDSWKNEEGYYDMGWKIGVWKNYFIKKEFYSIYDYGNERGTNIHRQEMVYDRIIWKDLNGNILSKEDIKNR